jgi:AmmeMemoRadiSam system protein B
MKENDRHLIELVTHMRTEEILREAEQHQNACGAGAVVSTVAAAKELGATQGYLLEHTTSQDVMPERRATDFVGYAGIIF